MATRTSMRAGHPLRHGAAGVAAAAVIMLLTSCGTAGSTAAGGTPTPSSQPAVSQPASSGAASSPAAGSSSQAPVPAESNPPGDIPDTTIYVPFTSAKGHVQLKVPEGWARKDSSASSAFTSNLNSISIAWQPMTAAPTVSMARGSTVAALSRAALAFHLQSVRAVRLAGGQAIEIVYQVNSPPNAVTGRQYRLVIERFELYRNGRGAVLSLSSALGSDNVDPWRIVSESFRWA
jgi:hypothetical protein